MQDIEIQENWQKLMQFFKSTIGKKPADLKAVLFLIGLQEYGRGAKHFSKEEKQDLMHIAICKVLSLGGFYEIDGYDTDGWPHWKLIKKLPPFDANTANDCLYYKADTKCFEYMVQHGFKITLLEVYYAHRRDNVLAVKYMHTQGFDLSTIRLDRERIQTTSAEMMQCLYEGEFQITEDTLVDAVVTNNLQVVKYLVELGCPVPSNVCRTAGTHHSLDVLVYLHEVKGYPLQCITRDAWNGQCDDYINQRLSELSRLANFFV